MGTGWVGVEDARWIVGVALSGEALCKRKRLGVDGGDGIRADDDEADDNDEDSIQE